MVTYLRTIKRKKYNNVISDFSEKIKTRYSLSDKPDNSFNVIIFNVYSSDADIPNYLYLVNFENDKYLSVYRIESKTIQKDMDLDMELFKSTTAIISNISISDEEEFLTELDKYLK